MITFFINLDDATSRRSKFKDTDYKRWKATPRKDVPLAIDNKMISRYNFPRESHLGRCGCFLSHTKLLEHIVDNKLDDVLILEDDAIKINEIPLDYPKDSIVYLGGFIHHKKMMNNQKIEIDTLNDVSGNKNYGFFIEDFSPEFDNETLQIKKSKQRGIIKTTKVNGAF